MAFRLFSGWDDASTTVNSTADGWSADIASYQVGRTGTGLCARLTSSGNLYVKDIPGAAMAAGSFGAGFRSNFGGSNNGCIFRFRDGAGDVFSVFCMDADGAIRVVRGSTSTANILGTSAAGVIVVNTWVHVEVVFTRSTTVGTVDVYLNGNPVPVLSLTGLNNGATDITAIGLNGVTNVTCDYDDLYVWDTAAQQGDLQAVILRPSTNDGAQQWTPLASTNISQVQDTTFDGDTTYNSSSTSGQVDSFNIDSFATMPLSIKAAQVVTVARKDDAGLRQVRGRLKSGATVSNGVTQTLALSYNVYRDLYLVDPDTGVAWTLSGIQAAKVQYENI